MARAFGEVMTGQLGRRDGLGNADPSSCHRPVIGPSGSRGIGVAWRHLNEQAAEALRPQAPSSDSILAVVVIVVIVVVLAHAAHRRIADAVLADLDVTRQPVLEPGVAIDRDHEVVPAEDAGER